LATTSTPLMRKSMLELRMAPTSVRSASATVLNGETPVAKSGGSKIAMYGNDRSSTVPASAISPGEMCTSIGPLS
jgi:hypothetical protein